MHVLRIMPITKTYHAIIFNAMIFQKKIKKSEIYEMKLREYVREEGIKQCALAQKIGITPLTLKSLMDGKRDFCLSVAIRIEEVTNHKVTCRDIVNPDLVKDYEKSSKRIKLENDRKLEEKLARKLDK